MSDAWSREVGSVSGGLDLDSGSPRTGRAGRECVIARISRAQRDEQDIVVI